jgi:hypothetical protein
MYQTPENKTVVFNFSGQIYDIDSKQCVNLFDSIYQNPENRTFVSKLKYKFNKRPYTYNMKRFIEATPVVGTNLILYSNYNNEINLLDVKNEIPYLIQFPGFMGKDVITSANKGYGNNLIMNSKKGTSFEIDFNENQITLNSQTVSNKSKLITSEHGNICYISYYDGELKIVSNIDSTKLNVSSYCIDEYNSSIFTGTANGYIKELKPFEKNKDYTIASLKDRINKIFFDEKNQILIVQVGANQLVMFCKLEWGFTKIYQETIGKRINDICLGKNGLVYVLYDRNRLVYWPTQNILTQLQHESAITQ